MSDNRKENSFWILLDFVRSKSMDGENIDVFLFSCINVRDTCEILALFGNKIL